MKWINSWYWRTKEKAEISYLEESGGDITAYEFKWNPAAKFKPPRLFLNHYPGSICKVIHPDNMEDFLVDHLYPQWHLSHRMCRTGEAWVVAPDGGFHPAHHAQVMRRRGCEIGYRHNPCSRLRFMI